MPETEGNLKVNDYSYEEMTARPFYKGILEKILPDKWAKNPEGKVFVDLATGAGGAIAAVMSRFSQLENVFGIDIDPKAIKSCREKFLEEGVHFLIGNIEKTPFASNSANIITCANAIHLTKIRNTLEEAYRVLKDGGVLAISSAYIGDVMYPTEESAKLWGGIAIEAFRLAVSEGYGDDLKRERKNRKNKQITQMGLEGYLEALKDTGFQKIEYFITVAKMSINDMLAILNYDEFAQGALPGIPISAAKRFLSEAAIKIYSSLDCGYIERAWVTITAQK